MDLEMINDRLGRIEDKMEALARLSVCMESIAEKIKYMDQVSKQRIGQLEQDVKVMKEEIADIRQRCITHTSRCPAEKISRFEWLIFGACVTTIGTLAVSLIVAYIQLSNVMPVK